MMKSKDENMLINRSYLQMSGGSCACRFLAYRTCEMLRALLDEPDRHSASRL